MNNVRNKLLQVKQSFHSHLLRSLLQCQLLTETGLPIPVLHSLLGHITVCTWSTWPHTVSITNIQFNIHHLCIIAQGHLMKAEYE